MKKRLFLLVSVLVLSITLAVPAFAATSNSVWYTVNSPNSNGFSHQLTAQRKEYAQVSVNTSNKTAVTVELWRSSFLGLGDTWFGADQNLTYGSGKRAWWIGDITANRGYHIHVKSSAPSMAVSGYFRNFF